MVSARALLGCYRSLVCNSSLSGLFPDTVDSITPDKVRGLRDMLNSSAMDIMYYTSPLYRDEVSVVLCKFTRAGGTEAERNWTSGIQVKGPSETLNKVYPHLAST